MNETDKFEMQVIEKDSPEYPEKLKLYSDMPDKLYVKGRLPDAKIPSAAIVGARAASPYGRIQAFRYARCLSEAGVQIISGLAYGVDTEAHKGALAGAAPTFSVLAGGADRCYPAGNRALYQRILNAGGGIISEQPPGVLARNYFFPARNRIISALADLVLVVEAREKSGSLITARWAAEQGKSVFAVPGMVTEDRALGCHRLIYDGAGIAYSPEILLEELGLNYENTVKSGEKTKNGLARDLKLVYSCLDLRPKSVDYIIHKTDLSPETAAGALLELKLSGLIEEVGRHHYIKVN